MRDADLKLDLDGRFPRGFEQRLAFVLRVVRWTPVVWWVRRTKHGWHVGVHLTRRPDPLKVIAVQAALGSDWRREVYNVAKWRKRWRRGTPEAELWNVLWHRKV